MNVMFTERHQYIITKLSKEKKVFVTTLAKELGVTPETIRRDLDILESEKKLQRIHGGAVKYHQTNNEPHFVKKMNLYANEKRAIGKKTAEFIKDGDTVMIDVGTTTIHLASSISGVRGVTIVTNSLAAAQELNNRLENKEFEGKVIVLGGVTNPEQKSIVGALTCKFLENFRFDKVFLSCGGISIDSVSDYDCEECVVSSVMVERANQVFLMADSSKLDNEAFYSICSLSKVDYIICDQAMPNEWKNRQLDTMLRWVIAEVGAEYEG